MSLAKCVMTSVCPTLEIAVQDICVARGALADMCNLCSCVLDSEEAS